MVVVDMSGKVVEGEYRRLPTPRRILNSTAVIRRLADCPYPFHACHRMGAGGAGYPALGTTHADYFFGDIPCTRGLAKKKCRGNTS